MKLNPPKIFKKNFQKNGKWIVKPSRTEIIQCECGNKYIKTREGQKKCLKCLSQKINL